MNQTAEVSAEAFKQRRKKIIRDTLANTYAGQPAGHDLKIIIALRRHIKTLDDDLVGCTPGTCPLLEKERNEMNEVLQEFILDLAMVPDEEIKK